MSIYSFTLIYSLILPNKDKCLLPLNSQTRVSNLLLFILPYSYSSLLLFTLTPLTYSPSKRTLGRGREGDCMLGVEGLLSEASEGWVVRHKNKD